MYHVVVFAVAVLAISLAVDLFGQPAPALVPVPLGTLGEVEQESRELSDRLQRLDDKLNLLEQSPAAAPSPQPVPPRPRSPVKSPPAIKKPPPVKDKVQAPPAHPGPAMKTPRPWIPPSPFDRGADPQAAVRWWP